MLHLAVMDAVDVKGVYHVFDDSDGSGLVDLLKMFVHGCCEIADADVGDAADDQDVCNGIAIRYEFQRIFSQECVGGIFGDVDELIPLQFVDESAFLSACNTVWREAAKFLSAFRVLVSVGDDRDVIGDGLIQEVAHEGIILATKSLCKGPMLQKPLIMSIMTMMVSSLL